MPNDAPVTLDPLAVLVNVFVAADVRIPCLILLIFYI